MNGLPKKLKVGGKLYLIRTDYRDILRIIQAFNDPELSDDEKCYVCMRILYRDYENLPQDSMQEAYDKAVWFIDCGKCYSEEKTQSVRLMDWEHDESLIIPAINRVAGKEVRMEHYIHWWTFVGFYMEIGECVFSEVVYIRQKLSKGKKLEKYERQFYQENKKMIDIPRVKTQEEIEEEKLIESIFG